MGQVDRNLESAIALDKCFLNYINEILTISNSLVKSATEAEQILRDKYSSATLQKIRDIVVQMHKQGNDAERVISLHKRKAELELEGYYKLNNNQ